MGEKGERRVKDKDKGNLAVPTPDTDLWRAEDRKGRKEEAINKCPSTQIYTQVFVVPPTVDKRCDFWQWWEF